MPRLQRALFWSVAEHPIYLLATIHVGPFGGYQFPRMTETLIHCADVAYFEIDPLKDPDMSSMYRPAISPTTLAEELGAPIYAQLKKTLSLKRPLEDHAPGGIADLIEGSTRSPVATKYSWDWGVDKLVCRRYVDLGKEIQFLESDEDQGRAAVTGPLHEIVAELEVWRTTGRVPRLDGQKLIAAYEGADLEELARLRLQSAPLRPTRSRAQLQDREARWQRKIAEMVASKKSALIAVGALHFPGNDGLLAALRNSGLTIDYLGAH